MAFMAYITIYGSVDWRLHNYFLFNFMRRAKLNDSFSVTVKPGDKPGMTKEVPDLFTITHRLHKIARRTVNDLDTELYCSLVGSDLPELNLLCDVTILEVITKGSPLALSHPQLQFVNKLVFSCVSKYIGSTGRFRTQIWY